ncbi:hypothetical protein [Aureispira anguillae]|uniref:Uncharacterized protein n=1 Tax=Aureispira anguillae TaxID=2864201 RepID=A0A915YFR8_9BACT|nr:hypothetical protein [Aureispira anguillae]BDS12313.1 hypothetical protein AsAng_0030340 [Aureispira anguillae]
MDIPVEVDNFYRFFWETPICQNIFLLHKELLLEKNSLDLSVADYYLQRIVLSNTVTSKEKTEEQLIFRQENKYAKLVEKLTKSKDKYFDEKKCETYLKGRFGQAFSLISKDFEEKGISLIFTKIMPLFNEGIEGLIELFKEYRVIPDSVDNTEGALMWYLETEFIKESGNFLRRQDISDIFLSVDNISHIYNSVIKDTLINGYKQNVSILIDKDNFKSRLDVFDRLYEINILIGGKFKSYIECIKCPPDTFNGYITFNVKPSQLKVKCPQCGKKANYLAPYYIHDVVYSHITDTDGLLSFAMEYIFYKKNISYTKSKNLENANEIDFVLGSTNNVKALIEVKMFRNDKDDSVKLSNIKKTIFQIKKTRQKLSDIDEKYINVPHFLVTNVIEENLIKEAKVKLKQDLKMHKISIFTPMEFYNYFHEEW